MDFAKIGKDIKRSVEAGVRNFGRTVDQFAQGIEEVFSPGHRPGGPTAPVPAVNGLASRANHLRTQGNDALQKQQFAQALNFYTQAIVVQTRVDAHMSEPSRLYTLYSNRSAVFMKMRQYENALGDAEMCVKLNPVWAKGYSRKGAALVALGRQKEAIKVLERGLQLDPGNKSMQHTLHRATVSMQLKHPSTPEEKVALLKQHGNQSLAAGQLHDALNYYTQAIACSEVIERDHKVSSCESPAVATAHKLYSNRSAVFMQLKQFENALADANECLQRAPQWPKAYSRVGAALVALGRYSAAKPILEQGLQLAPSNSAMKQMLHKATTTKEVTTGDRVQALKEQGNAAMKSRNYLQALEFYTKAINIEEQHTLYSNRSAVYMQLKRYGQALADANHCLRLAPQWPKSYSRVSAALIALKRFDAALGFVEKGLQYDPNNDVMKKMKATLLNERSPNSSTKNTTSPNTGSTDNTGSVPSTPQADLDCEEWQIDGDEITPSTPSNLNLSDILSPGTNDGSVIESPSTPSSSLAEVENGSAPESTTPRGAAATTESTSNSATNNSTLGSDDGSGAGSKVSPTMPTTPMMSRADAGDSNSIEGDSPPLKRPCGHPGEEGAPGHGIPAAPNATDSTRDSSQEKTLTDEEMVAADPTMKKLEDISPLLASIRFELQTIRSRHESGLLELDSLEGRGSLRKMLGDLHSATRNILHTEIDTLSTGYLADNDGLRARVQKARKELALEGMQLIQDIEEANATIQKAINDTPLIESETATVPDVDSHIQENNSTGNDTSDGAVPATQSDGSEAPEASKDSAEEENKESGEC